jgi:hypothetical protein
MFATGVSGEVSAEFSGEFPIDISDDIHFFYNSIIFLLRALRRDSGGLSDELSLFLLFCG